MKIKTLTLSLPSFSFFLLALLYNTDGRLMSKFSKQLLNMKFCVNFQVGKVKCENGK